MSVDDLDRILVSELTTAVDPRVTALVEVIVGASMPAAVLFYGSGLRTFDPEGLFDFYVVLDHLRDWPQPLLSRVANALLPPNVRYVEAEVEGVVLRAKVAFITRAQFAKRAEPDSLDTTIWARFCQPVRLVWVRDAETADAMLAIIRRCVCAAAGWAARLGNGGMPAADWWQTLFTQTYAAELRVEKPGRPRVVMEGLRPRYAAILPLAWRAVGLAFYEDGSRLSVDLDARHRGAARARWRHIAANGRWLNVMRLLKGAFTFDGGAAYLAWKIHRHNGLDLQLSAFERRHPLICLPWLLWRARSILRRPSRL